jgi:hypothetical protein
MKMEQADSSETSAYKIQTPGYYPEENIQQANSRFPQFCEGAKEGRIKDVVMNNVRTSLWPN